MHAAGRDPGIDIPARRVPGPADYDDRVFLPAGVHTLELTSLFRDSGGTLVPEDDAVAAHDDAEKLTANDLDIGRFLTMVGAGSYRTTIDAGGIERIFDVRDILGISGVTLQNGFSRGGGCLWVGGVWERTNLERK